MLKLGLFTAVLAAAVLNVSAASAQNYPEKQINIVVAFPPGGNTDVASRLVATSLGEQFNQRVVVENRPGAGTAIGTRHVARSNPDGYTILAADASPAITTLLQPDNGFEWNDVELVALLWTSPWLLLTAPNFPANSLSELIAYAKANPGKITWAHQGPGSVQRLVSERFIKAAGIEVTMVPYAGSAPAQLDVMEGRVDVTMDGLGTTMDRIKSNRYKALGVSGPQRYFELPDKPTFKEGGVDMSQMVWIGLFVPKGTPKDVIEKINKAVGVATDGSRFQEWVAKAGGGTAKPPAPEAKKIYEDDRVVWNEVITALGIGAK